MHARTDMLVVVLFALGLVIAAIDKHWFPEDVELARPTFRLAT